MSPLLVGMGSFGGVFFPVRSLKMFVLNWLMKRSEGLLVSVRNQSDPGLSWFCDCYSSFECCYSLVLNFFFL